MEKEIITFGGIEIEKGKFHHRKNLIFLEHGVVILNRSNNSYISI